MKKHLILSTLLALLSISAQARFNDLGATSPLENFQSTNLTPSEAQRAWGMIHKSPNKNSICSDRAMVWSYVLKRRMNIDSEKIFIHYTDTFRIVGDDNGKVGKKCFASFLCKKRWFYHVAPSIRINGKRHIFDPEFLPGIKTVKDWEYRFTKKVSNKLNNANQRRSIIAKLNEALDRYDYDNEKHIQARNTLELIRNSKRADGTYEVKCKRITHSAEHDFELSGRNAWCHTQFASMYYYTQNHLRQLNNNTINVLTPSLYSAENARLGRRYQTFEFYPSTIKRAMRKAFNWVIEEDEVRR